jgi:hypothetical protein
VFTVRNGAGLVKVVQGITVLTSSIQVSPLQAPAKIRVIP